MCGQDQQAACGFLADVADSQPPVVLVQAGEGFVHEQGLGLGILWTSGAAGFQNALVPVILISGNAKLINDDIDIDASAIMDGTAGVEEIACRIVDRVRCVANGEPARIEGIGDSTMTLYQKDQRVEALLTACRRKGK